MHTFISPAEQLEGLRLDGGWRVTELVRRSPAATGGFFSIGYKAVNDDGSEGFVKAINFSAAMAPGGDMIKVMRQVTEAFEFERDVCRQCVSKNMRNIVHALSDGTVQVDPANPLTSVPYLIFEMATGDIREQMHLDRSFGYAWTFRCLHNVSLGLNQLHGVKIGHQDLKPSNVLVFAGDISKISDFGRAASASGSSPFDSLPIMGDRTYAPPELLYGAIPQNWQMLRLGCDLYHLGSLASFLLCGVSFTALLKSQVPRELWRDEWQGSYEEVLPYITSIAVDAIEQVTSDLPYEIRNDTRLLISQLCHPDPNQRGHPKDVRGSGSQFSLQRYVTKFDVMRRRAEINLKGALR